MGSRLPLVNLSPDAVSQAFTQGGHDKRPSNPSCFHKVTPSFHPKPPSDMYPLTQSFPWSAWPPHPLRQSFILHALKPPQYISLHHPNRIHTTLSANLLIRPPLSLSLSLQVNSIRTPEIPHSPSNTYPVKYLPRQIPTPVKYLPSSNTYPVKYLRYHIRRTPSRAKDTTSEGHRMTQVLLPDDALVLDIVTDVKLWWMCRRSGLIYYFIINSSGHVATHIHS